MKQSIKICKNWKENLYNMPDECQSCNEEYNGFMYGFIIVNGLKIRIHLCKKCLKKLKYKGDKKP